MSRAQALNKLMIVIGLLFILLISLQSHSQTLHHKIEAELHPGLKMIKALDTLTFPKDSPRKISFLLHKDLQISVLSADDAIVLLHPATQKEPYAEYGLTLGNSDHKVTLSYYGVIHDPVVNDSSNGLISPEGATLFGSTYWYPFFLDRQKSFEVTVRTPAEWTSLVQGQMTHTSQENGVRISRFTEIYPQEEIYLVAGPFKVYQQELRSGKILRVLLRKDEPAVAESYLKLLPEYLQHYSDLIAPYPYSTFSVVENFWETGYGMPGFTLLGPTVLRLPFILTSSLPHEVLHNWWGNSVYVDYEKGNWCEGLTTYMADYWQQEKNGADRNYRLNTLINYNDFVAASPAKDFPLRQFRGRHNSSSQAVGYGKSMMLFHMLEFRFGKEAFTRAMQDFYTQNLFKKASFQDIQSSFEKVTHQNLEVFFSQWLDRSGAPQLELSDVKIMKWHDGAVTATYMLSQTQDVPYDLNIPIVWTLESGIEVRQVARLTDKSQVFSFTSLSRPVKIAVDPDFHVFRRLYTEERPATLSSVLGSDEIHYYVDASNAGARKFSESWARTTEGKDVFHDVHEVIEIPENGSLVFVGDHAAFASFMQRELAEQNFAVTDKNLTVNGQTFALNEVSSVVVARLKQRPQQTVVWVRWSPDNNPAEWAGRLTHYGTFGVLVFKGRPVVVKTNWPVIQSPLQKPL